HPVAWHVPSGVAYRAIDHVAGRVKAELFEDAVPCVVIRCFTRRHWRCGDMPRFPVPLQAGLPPGRWWASTSPQVFDTRNLRLLDVVRTGCRAGKFITRRCLYLRSFST